MSEEGVGFTLEDFNDMASRYNALQTEYNNLKKNNKDFEKEIKSLTRKYQARINKNKSYIDKIVALSNNYLDTIIVLNDTIRIIKEEKLIDEKISFIELQEINLVDYEV